MAQESLSASALVRNPSAWDIVYSINMGIACWIAYATMTRILISSTPRDDDLLGGMWAAAAVAFVFRDTRAHSLSAGIARLFASCVSFGLCLLYLAFIPPTVAGIPILIAVGTLVMILLNRRADIVTTAITTIVVMVEAIISPSYAWAQPLLRIFDTAVGIGIGVACKWAGSAVFSRLQRSEAEPETMENQ